MSPYYDKDGISIYNGDCVEVMRALGNNLFDIIVTDPPYNQKYHYESYRDNMPDSEYRKLLQDVFADRKCVIIHYPEQAIKILPTIGLGELKEVVSWVYNSNTAKQHRLITWWNCSPDFRLIPQQYKNPKDKRIAKRIAEGKSARAYDWWQINQVKNVSKGIHGHSCPIPIEIAERIIKSTSKPGDTIIDHFAGSCTTAIAAKKLGRKCICIEISEKYCEIGKKRIEEL